MSSQPCRHTAHEMHTPVYPCPVDPDIKMRYLAMLSEGVCPVCDSKLNEQRVCGSGFEWNIHTAEHWLAGREPCETMIVQSPTGRKISTIRPRPWRTYQTNRYEDMLQETPWGYEEVECQPYKDIDELVRLRSQLPRRLPPSS